MMLAPVRFESLIERYHDEIYGYLWRLLDSAAGEDGLEAEDLAQEVFLRAYRGFGRLRPDSNYRAWLYKIATHCAYTALKRRQRYTLHNTPLLDDAPLPDGRRSPAQEAELDETLQAVRRAIEGLPAKQRAAVVMRHVQGMEYAEIAQALECSEESARANVYQACKRLRYELREKEDEPAHG